MWNYDLGMSSPKPELKPPAQWIIPTNRPGGIITVPRDEIPNKISDSELAKLPCPGRLGFLNQEGMHVTYIPTEIESYGGENIGSRFKILYSDLTNPQNNGEITLAVPAAKNGHTQNSNYEVTSVFFYGSTTEGFQLGDMPLGCTEYLFNNIHTMRQHIAATKLKAAEAAAQS